MTSTLPPLVQAVSGAVGSASASALTYPLDLISTRLQLDSPVHARRRGGVSGGLRLLLYIVYGSKRKGKKGLGWKALYDGLGSDLFATVLSNFFYFYFYTFLRSISQHGLKSLPLMRNTQKIARSKHKVHKPTLFEDILLGFVAGVASRAVSTPLNIITLRLQAERADAADEDAPSSPTSSAESSPRPSSPIAKDDMGITDVAKMIYQEQGWKGFWKGFGTSALLSINPSITLSFFQLFRTILTYSRTRRAVDAKAKAIAQNLTPGEAFFVGAIANSIANTVLYPLILAKKRLQTGTGDTLISVLWDAYLGKYDPHGESEEASTEMHGEKRPPLPRRNRSKYYEGEPVAGIEGLYQGLQMQLLKGFFNQGMTFLVKGRIEQLVVAAYLRQRALKLQTGS